MNTARRDMREIMRDEMIMKDRILALLQEETKTVPEIAEALGAPEYETVFWMMAMRRYGMLEETGRPDVDGYFKYEFKEQEEEGHE
ncbi:MAG: MarR family transcriptional regulator [Verrucomicrobia bacterium]|nr:MAG: MarR family transcriptional regulator [Verrucomicrobiota bacterium]